MSSSRYALACARSNRQRFEGELAALVGLASASAQPQHADDAAKCAAWLAAYPASITMHTEPPS